MSRAPAAPLALALVAALGCGGRKVPAAPRSTCADAAAAIARGLHAATGEPAITVEAPLAALCRSAAWRPAVVRCFALARDPAEHRICARRLEPAQRDDARVLQANLYGAPADASERGQVRYPPACMRLRGAFERFAACDRMGANRMEVAALVSTVLERAGAEGLDPGAVAMVSLECERLGAALRSAVEAAGC